MEKIGRKAAVPFSGKRKILTPKAF